MARDLSLEDKNLNGVHTFRFTIHKNGVAWSGIDSAKLILEKPDRSTQVEKSLVLEADITGIWYYTTTTADLDTTGYWTAAVEVIDGTITVRYPGDIGFYVRGNP